MISSFHLELVEKTEKREVWKASGFIGRRAVSLRYEGCPTVKKAQSDLYAISEGRM